VQIPGLTNEDRPDAGHCGDGVGVLQTLCRFDHHDGHQVAVRIQWPDVAAPLVFGPRNALHPGALAVTKPHKSAARGCAESFGCEAVLSGTNSHQSPSCRTGHLAIRRPSHGGRASHSSRLRTPSRRADRSLPKCELDRLFPAVPGRLIKSNGTGVVTPPLSADSEARPLVPWLSPPRSGLRPLAFPRSGAHPPE